MKMNTLHQRRAERAGNALVLIVVAGFLALAFLAAAWDLLHL